MFDLKLLLGASRGIEFFPPFGTNEVSSPVKPDHQERGSFIYIPNWFLYISLLWLRSNGILAMYFTFMANWLCKFL